jgi:nucleotide-binding universal stress UspA family protein
MAATDGTDHGKKALETGAAFAKRADADFAVIIVADAPLPDQPLRAAGEPTDWSEVLKKHMRSVIAEQAESAGIEGATIHTATGKAAPAIVDKVESLGVDMLVLGAHHTPAISRFLLGSTSEKVARLTKVPVLVAAESRKKPFARVLAAVDTSDQSPGVLNLAATFATLDRAIVRVIHVWEPIPPIVTPHQTVGGMVPVGASEAKAIADARRRDERARFERLFGELDQTCDLELEKSLRTGHAGAEIVKEANEWDADLVVMGTHGAGFFDRLMMGSRSLYVLRHCERSTLMMPCQDKGH